MGQDGWPLRRSEDDDGQPGSRRWALFGVRDPLGRLVIVCTVVVGLGVGAYLCYDRYVARPKREKDLIAGEADAKRHARWQRSGRQGWEQLFTEAARGLPGYMVDTGMRARLKLAELGPKIVPFVEEKLESDLYTERLTAIHLLAAVGEPSDRIVSLLKNEVQRAPNGHPEIGALKCAASLLNRGDVLAEVSFAALESPRAKTRQMAVAYLFGLRGMSGAPPGIGERLAELRTGADLKIRIEIAMHLTEEDATASYRTLLEGLDSADEQTVMVAVNRVGQLRGEGTMDPVATTPEQKAEMIGLHRAWLEEKLSEAQEQEPAAEELEETSPEEQEEATDDPPAEEAPQQTEPEQDCR